MHNLIPIKMNYKGIFDNWLGFVFGVFGYGYTTTLFGLVIPQSVLQVLVASITALFAGGFGVVGKYLAVWAWKKIKLFIIKK